jgi:hypothetical protein
VPPAGRAAGANASGHARILPRVPGFPRVGGKPGRPKERPDELYADRGDAGAATRGILRFLGVEPRIAKRGTPDAGGLGGGRGVVERAISRVEGLRRRRARCDRRGVIRDAFTTLAASVICLRILVNDTM